MNIPTINKTEVIDEVNEWLAFTHELAEIAAAEIRPHFRSGYQVEYKSDNSPVTVADRNAEQAMRQAIMRRYPQHGILGEEFDDYQPNAQYQWVLDPIDGTKAFVSGSYLFGTLVALMMDGKPLVGAINNPIIGDYLVGNGEQTWLNGELVHVSECTRIENAILLNTDHWNVGRHQNGEAFEALSRGVKRYNNWGDCHGYYLVATGGAEIMTDPIMNMWDMMALIPVIEGAGGRITDWKGEDPLTGSGIVATCGPIHNEVIRLLNPE